MPEKNIEIIELQNPRYVPVTKDALPSYGGSQMWFSKDRWLSKDYVIHNYGCGTIAAADVILYLTLQNNFLQSPDTKLALQGSCSLQDNESIQYNNYISYVNKINDQYTKTRRIIAVLGPKLASAMNEYTKQYDLDYRASWKWRLNYYDMYAMIEEMLSEDIPVILSIGPNTPNLWGKKGISFYEKIESENTAAVNKDINLSDDLNNSPPTCYKAVCQDINSHYVTVTALIKDDATNTIMLRISSWGRQYYINYVEYRDYVENFSSPITSSIVYLTKLLY